MGETRTAWGAGFETQDGRGAALDCWFRSIGWGEFGESAPTTSTSTWPAAIVATRPVGW